LYTNKSVTRLRVIKTDETGSILVGTDDITEPEQNIIRPNPTNGRFKIDIEDVRMVEIYDVCGILITTSQHNREIDISACKAGVYFARISTGNGVVSHKIIKK
jgi:hypothetical protein